MARQPRLAVVVLLAAAAGCATFEPSTSPPPGTFTVDVRLPATGTKWIVKETQFNEHTSTSRSQVVTWTAMGEGMHGGKAVYRLSDGTHVHARDRATGSFVALLDRNATELVSHAPHEGDVSSPLWVGKSWAARSTYTSRLTGRTLHNVVVVWKVAAYEDVQVPAGTFKAFRLEAWNDERDSIRKRTFWYAPAVPLVVKEVTEGHGSPYKVGVGRDWIKVTTELVQYAPPTATPARPEPPPVPSAAAAAALGVPALVETLTHHPGADERVAAADLLAQRFARSAEVRAALPALRAMLDDAAPALQAGAGRALLAITAAQADPAAAVAVATARDPGLRLEAMWALGRLGAPAGPAMPVVVNVMRNDSDERVRVAAATAVRKIGPAASDLPAIAALLDDPNPALRTEVAAALAGRIPDVMAILATRTRDANPEARRQTTQTLGALGRIAPADVLQPLADALDDPDAEVRAVAVRRLADIGEPAFRILRAALRHLDANVRGAAAHHIVAIPSRRAHAIGALIEVLSDPDVGVRSGAVRALGGLGAVAGDETGELRARLGREACPDVRALRERALADIAPR
jgi:HEAT repeat protein